MSVLEVLRMEWPSIVLFTANLVIALVLTTAYYVFLHPWLDKQFSRLRERLLRR